MKIRCCALLAAVFSFWPIYPASAATITFDFDSGTPALSAGQNLPLDQTAGGLTAHFSFPSGFGFGGFSVQNAGTTFFALSLFSGNYLYPNSLDPGPLDILFSQPISSISFPFATADFNQNEVPTTIKLTAYENSTANPAVGSATAHGSYGSDTMPMGTLTFNSSGQSFNLVEISVPFQPLGTSDFLVDNIAVTPAGANLVPEPVSFTLVGGGLLSLLARRRLGSRKCRQTALGS